jgi:hypothetical protein
MPLSTVLTASVVPGDRELASPCARRKTRRAKPSDTRERGESATGLRTGGCIGVSMERPPIDTRRARCPHAVTLGALRLECDGRTRVPKPWAPQWIAEPGVREAALERDVL